LNLQQLPAARIAVLASGNGSNLQAILDQVEAGVLQATVALVVSDKPGAKALERASAAGVETRLIAPADFPDRDSWNREIATALLEARVGIVILAGFMRIIGRAVLEAFPGRILNIHPSILPNYPGLHTYEKALAAGDSHHGTSVHFVTEQLDGGPLIAQAILPIAAGEDEQSLRARVQAAEHWLFPLIIGWLAAGRVEMRDSGTWLDGELLQLPVQFTENGPQRLAADVKPSAM